MSLWAFRFLLWYICIQIVQPQNRFLFLYPFRIANVCIITAMVLHVLSAMQNKQPIIRLGPGTITAFLLLVASFTSLYTGPLQTSSAWNTYTDMLTKNIIVLILTEAMVTSVARAWAVLMTMTFATLWWIKGGVRLSMAGMTLGGDRLFGPAASLVINPNQFAYMMCVFIPLYLYFYQQAPTRYYRWAFLGVALAAIFITLRTGSRAGLLQLMALGPALLPKYGRKYKRAILVGAAVFIFLMPLIGGLNIKRFKTIPDSIRAFLSGEIRGVEELSQDQQSAQDRRLKNRDAWALIKDHPLFGAGINADETLIALRYPSATGQVHCEILMAGRQMGFIGMGFYVALVAILLMSSRRIQIMAKDWWPTVSDIGWTIKLQTWMFLIGGLFAPIVWHPIMMILVGLSSALGGLMKREVALRTPGE